MMLNETVSEETPQKRGLFSRFRRQKEVKQRKREIEVPKKVKTSPRDLRGKLQRGKYPITDERYLTGLLGGRDQMVDVKGGPPVRASEIASRCFSQRRSFSSPDEVESTFYTSSWKTTVLRRLNLFPFPIKSPGRLSNRAGDITVEGVKVRDLASSLEYPISSTAELLEKLYIARKARRNP
jgi:hypothetical protein